VDIDNYLAMTESTATKATRPDSETARREGTFISDLHNKQKA
jgi:hypothetical protein